MKRFICILIGLMIVASMIAIEKYKVPGSVESLLADTSIGAMELYNRLITFNQFPDWAIRDDIVSLTYPVSDTTNAPFHVRVPASYSPSRPAPVIIYLHGGVGVPYFYEDFEKELNDFGYMVNPYSKEYIIVYPQSKNDCEWWDPAGQDLIMGILYYLKSQLNIDDDRIYLTGESDGGSGSYHMALTMPSAFGAFIPIIGMMTVGSYETLSGVYPINLTNRSLYASNADQDRLYPAAEMRKMVQLALDAGVNITYKEFNGYGHDSSFMEKDPRFAFEFMQRHTRDPLAPHISWEAETADYGSCDWISIARIDTSMTAQPWHVTFQDSIQNHRLTIGFHIDMDYKGEGVRVSAIVDGETVANAIGLQAGDIIVSFDHKNVEKNDDIEHYKSETDFGNPISLTVMRGSTELTLEGTLPEASYFNAFFYPKKSARVDADFYANCFDIKSSRVKALKIRIHPDMVNMLDPVKVIVNGHEVFNGMVEADRDYIKNQFRDNLDRKALWVNELYIPVHE